MVILGLHGSSHLHESEDLPGFEHHDAAAVIWRDGIIVAAVEEERLNRVKHTSCFPARAIRSCLAQAHVDLSSVDAIAWDGAEEICDFVCTRMAATDPRSAFKNGREMLAATFEVEFHIDVSQKIRFCRHHVAHLFSAWYPSGFEDGLALCLDGDGDAASGLIATFDPTNFHVLRYLPENASLGVFYAQQIFFLGYQAFDEYKAMGLAPYGDPSVYEDLFRRMYGLQSDGRFTILPWNERIAMMYEEGLIPKARRKGEAFTQAHKNFAATLQLTLERIVEHILIHFQRLSKTRQLCISGGVGHNCTLNGRLLRSGRFDKIYVQPAAHDAGNALGAALAVAHQLGQTTRDNLLPHVFLGTDIGSNATIADVLKAWMPLVEVEALGDAPRTAAEFLASGSVVAWVQGRSEFGPRALGNRSILADPRPADNKRIINAMVKKREEFRPFAPAVLEEKLRDYFEVPRGTHAVPFMVVVLPVRPHARDLLGAVTHVDGSARVQSVSSSDNPRFYSLIAAFWRETGVPIVLNTSFNNHAEPIVDSVNDAITAFLTTGVDVLIIGDWLVRRRVGLCLSDSILSLVPSISPGRTLTCRASRQHPSRFQIESTAKYLGGSKPITVSREVFGLLADDDHSSIRMRCVRHGFSADVVDCLGVEFLHLWTERAVRLSPLATSLEGC